MSSQRLSAFTADGLSKPHHGDAFHELLTFDIHFFQWAFGAITEVAALADAPSGTARELTATFASEAVRATCYVSDTMPAGYPFTENVRVLFAGGSAELTMRFWPDRIDSELRVDPLGGDPEVIVVRGEDPFVAQARHFVSAANGLADRRYADGEIAVELLRVTAAAAAAADTGRTIYLSGQR
jgi:predicted dehydrogenase